MPQQPVVLPSQLAPAKVCCPTPCTQTRGKHLCLLGLDQNSTPSNTNTRPQFQKNAHTFVCLSFTSSTPSISPLPRTSPITSCLLCSCLRQAGQGRCGTGRPGDATAGHELCKLGLTYGPAGSQQACTPPLPPTALAPTALPPAGAAGALPPTGTLSPSSSAPQAFHQVSSHVHAVLLQALLLNDPQHRAPRCHRHRVAACWEVGWRGGLGWFG